MIVREVPDAPEPPAALSALMERPGPFLIQCNETADGDSGLCSFAGADPSRIVTELSGEPPDDLPHGTAGYILGRHPENPSDVPAIEFRQYDPLVRWDRNGRCELVTSRSSIEEGSDRLLAALNGAKLPPVGPPRPQSPLRSNLGRDEFLRTVRSAVDAEQFTVAMHYEVRLAEDPLSVYLRFRKTLGAPVTAFFGGQDGDVLASSDRTAHSVPSADHYSFGVRSAGGDWHLSPIHRALTHQDGVYRFCVTVSIDRRSNPAEVYTRSMVEARPLAAVLGFRL